MPLREIKAFCYGAPKLWPDFRGGTKNNQCPGTFALLDGLDEPMRYLYWIQTNTITNTFFFVAVSKQTLCIRTIVLVMITLNFFHTCFFTCFFFLGCFWSIFMTILTHNLFAEGQNSRLIFGLSFWHFVVDDFVVRCRQPGNQNKQIFFKFSSPKRKWIYLLQQDLSQKCLQ